MAEVLDHFDHPTKPDMYEALEEQPRHHPPPALWVRLLLLGAGWFLLLVGVAGLVLLLLVFLPQFNSLARRYFLFHSLQRILLAAWVPGLLTVSSSVLLCVR